jgi:hypothetical protein
MRAAHRPRAPARLFRHDPLLLVQEFQQVFAVGRKLRVRGEQQPVARARQRDREDTAVAVKRCQTATNRIKSATDAT